MNAVEEEGLLALLCALGAAGDDQGWKVPLADGGGRTTFAPGLNPISRALSEWLTRHLDKSEVLDWALRSGSVLHPDFRWIIRRRLADKPDMPAALRHLWKVLASEAALVRSNVHRFSFDLHEFLADHIIDGTHVRKVAVNLTIPDAENSGRQVGELVEGTTLKHPHLMTCFHAGSASLPQGRFLYLVMEVAEESLQTYLTKRTLAGTELCEVVEQIASALVWLHQQKPVHRDVKPANGCRRSPPTIQRHVRIASKRAADDKDEVDVPADDPARGHCARPTLRWVSKSPNYSRPSSSTLSKGDRLAPNFRPARPGICRVADHARLRHRRWRPPRLSLPRLSRPPRAGLQDAG